MTNHEPLTAALLLFCVADYIKNSLESASRKANVMNQYEKFKINQELQKIREEIAEIKKNRMYDLDEISDCIINLENKIENLQEG